MHKLRNLENFNCVVCNKNFARLGTILTCSPKCHNEYIKENYISQNYIKRKYAFKQYQCEFCGNFMHFSEIGKKENGKKYFCSLACATGNEQGYREDLSCEHGSWKDILTIADSAVWSGSKIVKKGWGCEVHIINTLDYCLKYLIFLEDHKFSDHSHNVKRETFHNIFGSFDVCLKNRENEQEICFIMRKGDVVNIERCLIHQLRAREDNILIEVSTQDFPEDSYRISRGD